MLYWEDISNMDHYFFTAENPAEGATFTYYLAQPAQRVGLVVTGPTGKTIREINGPGEAGVIHRVNWDLRFPAPAGVGRGGGGGEEGGGGAFGPGTEKPGVVALPIPSHDIGPRGPHIAPGTFKVALDIDGTVAESRTFEVRADPGSTITLTQHKAREAFEVEVLDLLAKIETLAADLGKRRAAATGDAATRLRALEQRLIGGPGGRGRGAAATEESQPPGPPAAPAPGVGRGAQPVRQRLGGLITAFVGSGARTGSLSPPTTTMREVLAQAKADLAAIEKESK